jgi:integrase
MSDEVSVKVNSYGPGRPLGLVYFDPISGRKKAKSSRTTDWREAERLAGELEKQLRAGKFASASRITWQQFRQRYEGEQLALKSESHRSTSATAFNMVERVLNPDRLAKVTTTTMSRFIAALRAEKMKESTLACYLRALKAGLRWANRMDLLATVPAFAMPRAGDAKARPVTAEEYDRMLAAVPKVRPHDAPAWRRLLTGLWLSGLRLGEGLRLSWDVDAPFAVDLSGRFPAFAIEARAQKGRRDERLPMTPDFARWLLDTFPEGERVGRVFKLMNPRNARPVSAGKVTAALGTIGEKARVVVAKDSDTGKVKYASAHDLRRSFGTRWAKRVMPAVLQRLMRHKSINTTMKYYVGIEADDVAADLWAKFQGPGNTLGNNAPAAGKNAETVSAQQEAATLDPAAV